MAPTRMSKMDVILVFYSYIIKYRMSMMKLVEWSSGRISATPF